MASKTAFDSLLLLLPPPRCASCHAETKKLRGAEGGGKKLFRIYESPFEKRTAPPPPFIIRIYTSFPMSINTEELAWVGLARWRREIYRAENEIKLFLSIGRIYESRTINPVESSAAVLDFRFGVGQHPKTQICIGDRGPPAAPPRRRRRRVSAFRTLVTGRPVSALLMRCGPEKTPPGNCACADKSATVLPRKD